MKPKVFPSALPCFVLVSPFSTVLLLISLLLSLWKEILWSLDSAEPEVVHGHDVVRKKHSHPRIKTVF